MSFAVPQILLRGLCLFLAVCGFAVAPAQAAEPYQVGVYYYPGWSPFTKGAHEPDPWKAIKRFPEREPALGWYDDRKQATIDKQIAWMAEYGIAFAIFDWYWENAKPAPQHSVEAYLRSPARSKVKYALLWANHGKEPRTLAEWDALSDFWIARHLKNPEYLKIDGKPALFIFSPDVLRDQAQVIGWPVGRLLDRARDKARAAGLTGIYFVMGTPANEYWAKAFVRQAGVDALTAYNYHGGVDSDGGKARPVSTSYDELDQGYRSQWKWLLENTQLPYFVPVTSGWDRRAWGGSQPPEHDKSVSTPDSFETHLRAARAAVDAHPAKTRRIVTLCCWNEFGEGSYVEPTKRYGTQYLERVRKVFVDEVKP